MNLKSKSREWIFRHKRRLLIGLCCLSIGIIFLFVSANAVCERAAKNKVFHSLDSIPKSDVALVLGTGKTTRNGNPNLHFTQRIRAAAKLYHAGKVRCLLVSGDNHRVGYDEPSDMRDALMAAGVPSNAIVCDYAGFRTLDSVVRAKIVFGLSSCTIVSEEFHCPRALWIAQRHGLEAVAFAAPDLDFRWSTRVKVRECFARLWCGIDLYLLQRNPKFTGPHEPILLSAK